MDDLFWALINHKASAVFFVVHGTPPKQNPETPDETILFGKHHYIKKKE